MIRWTGLAPWEFEFPSPGSLTSTFQDTFFGRGLPEIHQQCDVNYIEIRRTTVWSYEFRRRIDGRVPPAEGTRPYEKLPIPTNLDIPYLPASSYDDT